MGKILNKAIVGVADDDEARRVLLAAAQEGLMRKAGMIPAKTKAKNKKRDLKNARSGSDRLKGRIEHYADELERMNDFGIWHHNLPRINGIEQMPIIQIVRMDSFIHEAFEFSKGRAWLAGSAALWTVVDETWRYGDIDIFAYSSEDYEALYKELCHIGGAVKRADKQAHISYSWLFNKVRSNEPPAINLVNPCGEDWSNPISLLKTFDWTIAATAISTHENCIAYSPRDIRSRELCLLDTHYPETIIMRMLKYMQRGFGLNPYVLSALCRDDRFKHDLRLIAAAAPSSKSHLKQIADAWQTHVENTGYKGSSYYDDDQYEDDYDYDYEDN